jgi:hypothetical protein
MSTKIYPFTPIKLSKPAGRNSRRSLPARVISALQDFFAAAHKRKQSMLHRKGGR